MSIAVLDDQAPDALRPARRQMIGDGCAEIVDIQEEALHSQRSQERVDRVGDVLERVVVGICGWR
jgi:hypothetical protein